MSLFQAKWMLLPATMFLIVAGVSAGFVLRPSSGSGVHVPPRPVSEREAVSVLASTVELATRDSWSELCSLPGAGGLGCDAVGSGSVRPEVRAARPVGEPTIVSGREVNGTDCRVPGYVLELRGVDANGKDYHSDFFVSRDFDGNLTVSMPIYWYGGRLDDQPACHVGS